MGTVILILLDINGTIFLLFWPKLLRYYILRLCFVNSKFGSLSIEIEDRISSFYIGPKTQTVITLKAYI